MFKGQTLKGEWITGKSLQSREGKLIIKSKVVKPETVEYFGGKDV